MLLPSDGVRKRKTQPADAFVREFDAFNKVADKVKEETTIISGIYSVCCFALIFCLCASELYHYFYADEVSYAFKVDTAYDEQLVLDLDMIVAAPCNEISIMTASQNGKEAEDDALKKQPSRFDMDEDEQKLWNSLSQAHKSQFEPGTRLKSLNDISFASNGIEEGLQSIAKEKVDAEMKEVRKQQAAELLKKGDNTVHGHRQVVMFVSNGMGMFQMISANSDNGPQEGRACRVSGSIPVLKGDRDKVMVSAAGMFNLNALFGSANGETKSNFSHRIERFHFGRHIYGLVTPLAGSEQISESGQTMYKYFIKIVPTVIYNSFGLSQKTYQYAVTSMKREFNESGFMSAGITFAYEFVGHVIEVRPDRIYLPKILNGGLAGIVGVTCVFPLDLVKTRLQNQRPDANGKLQYKGILDCFRQTWQSGGASTIRRVAGMYSGSGVNILLITPEKAIKLVANDFFRYQLSTPGQKHLSTLRGMVAGGSAGFCQIIVTTPMELLKIQCQQATGAKVSATKLAISLVKEKGIAGLYRGVGPTMARDVAFSMIYFPLFAKLDSIGPRKSDGSGDAMFLCSLVSGFLAGSVGSFSVTPLDVIKTRIQLINNAPGVEPYKGITDAFVKILKNEGPLALFKGAAARVLVMAPLFGIAQTVYYVGVAEYFLGIQKAHHV